jgi:oligopeptide transport system ATP-binding protein
MHETPPLLRVEGLTKRFPGHGDPDYAAVDNVSFRVSPGKAVAVVGESGSGKTTLARMIVGLEQPTSGRIIFAGRERRLSRISTRERRRRAREAQIVFQDPYSSLNRRQRIRDAIAEPLRLHFSLSREAIATRVDQLLDQVGLTQSEGRAWPSELSGGQRQRAAIARGLAADPQLLILDEAVSALDVSIQAQIINLLADIQTSTNVAYLCISHDLAVVRQICDEAIVMHRGEVVESGAVETILDHPHHPYTIALRQSVPRPGWHPTRRSQRQSDASQHSN